MRWIDGLNKAQRVVVVIALGLALGAAGSYVVSPGRGAAYGWTGYAPLTASPYAVGGGLHPWLRLIVWLVLIALWAVASLRVLQPASRDGASE